jgi:hypothetical protein
MRAMVMGFEGDGDELGVGALAHFVQKVAEALDIVNRRAAR